MRSHESQPLNLDIPNTDLIEDLKRKHLIKDGSPFWWGTDNLPDPREYMPFGEFLGKLAHIGIAKTTTYRRSMWGDPDLEHDIYLYPQPRVPMTVMELEVNGRSLPLLITARPYHEKELRSEPFSRFLREHPTIDDLRGYVASGGTVELPGHFYPHVRGLFAGRRGNNYFWYLMHITGFRFGDDVKSAMKNKGFPFIGFHEPWYAANRTYYDVWSELEGKSDLVDTGRPRWIDFEATEVSAEKFIKDHNNSDLLLFYPLRVEGIEKTLPLAIASKSHKESIIRKPIVLGIYAENGLTGRCRRGGIIRIKDRQLAQTISTAISEEFGIPVDTLLFTPQKGKPKYERIST
ncbi:MAG: hypothetical protein M1372_00055 [Patescibacteria group bacterium]|nr:hypothetical protein [Patescibacteria group bacterium]